MTRLIILTPGLFYGACAEMCGAYHRMMPIVVERVPFREYIKFLESGVKLPDTQSEELAEVMRDELGVDTADSYERDSFLILT